MNALDGSTGFSSDVRDRHGRKGELRDAPRGVREQEPKSLNRQRRMHCKRSMGRGSCRVSVSSR